MALRSLRSSSVRVGRDQSPQTSLRWVRAHSQAPGSKVEQWLKTPFDVLTFGARAGVGALVSLPERLSMLPSELEKVQELIQDPRPLEEKQAVVLQEVEDTLVSFLQRGASVEADVIANVRLALPPELAQQLEAVIPPPPSAAQPDAAYSPPTGVVVDEEDVVVVYTADSVLESQIASELTEVRYAVGALRAALEALRANTDSAKASMLRLNLREARDILARRVLEAAPPAAAVPGGASERSLAGATREAKVLLEEVDAQFGF